jgi:hypothetical protein
VTLDHYIPRCLTRPWHDERIGQYSLRVFDFERRAFAVRNAERFFARRGINAPETESYLSRYIETPFAETQDAIRAAAPNPERMQAAFAQLPVTALVGLFWLQIQRIRDAHHPRTEYHLDEFAQRGYEWLEQFSMAVLERYEPLLYGVTNVLLFPEIAIFLIPIFGQMPIMALPIDTGLALVFADRQGDQQQLDEFMRRPNMATACSIGISERARRVVLPPELPQLPAVQSLLDKRAVVRELFKTYSDAGFAAGLPTVWRLDEPQA